MAENRLRGQYAGFATRTVALFIDVAAIVITLLVVNWLLISLTTLFHIDVNACQPLGANFSIFNVMCVATSAFLVIFSLAFAPAYLVFFWVVAGQTLGKAVMGVRVVQMNGHHVELFVALRRLVGYVISFLPLGLGFLWVLVDDDRRGWHDRIAGTCVIYAWEARQNEQFLTRVRHRASHGRKPKHGGEVAPLEPSPSSETGQQTSTQQAGAQAASQKSRVASQ